MKIKAVVNPQSANGKTHHDWPAIEQKLVNALGPIDVDFTEGIESAIYLTRHALKEGYEHIIAVGGDGTTNETINGFFENDKLINSNAIFSVISRGTGGDFGKTIGVSKQTSSAIKSIVEGKVTKMDVGKITFVGNNGRGTVRYFNNIASFGMGGEVDRRVNASSAAKLIGGKGAFLWATLRTTILYKNKKIRLTIDDHYDEELIIRNVAIANGQYFGGGMWVAPKAKIDDGIFDVVIIGDVSRRSTVMNMSSFYDGSHVEHPDISYLHGKKIVATSDEEVLLDVDGEAPGRLNATFEILPGAIKLKC